mmetsp:Transcript_10463/g.10531  ORF Transcript_10463/g.10531 Transcript_10463/m.10531 type:complete len:159 (-) Transcript_10463:277-753(-)|eukprot:CAMPEP_0182427412 /NCGR_PEP_ID=MMETSP1167-20130531/17152_1 /TAXON_ID=2988 /ORGANISM="Mallomonas Sp, Strain CCMP3275" /LENGTH=158 /DNA_ID=CAMNT_0024609623 /DNA_START=293 /DNA_END=769 /DNA_ORIENTATION=+
MSHQRSSIPPENGQLRDALLDAYKKKYGTDDADANKTLIKRNGRQSLMPINKLHSGHAPHHKHVEVDRWWEKPPSLAGESCTQSQKRLCDVESFTGMYKKRFENDTVSQAISGDFCDRPIRATRLLNSTPVNRLTITKRAGDFRTEVEWRLQLRPQFN